VTDDEAIARVADARVGRMATVRPDGTPHVMPFVFALVVTEGVLRLYWAVDRKPKTSDRLQRVDNIRANPAVEVVIDRYDDDWDRLWWVRLNGTGRVVTSAEERAAALDALAAKYPAYGAQPPEGNLVAIDVRSVSQWPPDPSPR
jgi:PPOX class probable F420-dependent enzyme